MIRVEAATQILELKTFVRMWSSITFLPFLLLAVLIDANMIGEVGYRDGERRYMTVTLVYHHLPYLYCIICCNMKLLIYSFYSILGT